MDIVGRNYILITFESLRVKTGRITLQMMERKSK